MGDARAFVWFCAFLTSLFFLDYWGAEVLKRVDHAIGYEEDSIHDADRPMH